MRGKRALSTRRRRALGWIILLCGVLLANHFLGLYCVTQGQALRQMSAQYGLPSMELWRTLDLPQAQDEMETCALTYNEDYLLLSTLHFDFGRGWTAEPMTLVPNRNEPALVGEADFCKETEEGYETVYVFFGFAGDPEITAVEMAVRHASLTEDEMGVRMVNFPWQRSRVSAGDFQLVGQSRVFLTVLDPVYDPGGSTYPKVVVRLRWEDGRVKMSRRNLSQVFSGRGM